MHFITKIIGGDDMKVTVWRTLMDRPKGRSKQIFNVKFFGQSSRSSSLKSLEISTSMAEVETFDVLTIDHLIVRKF